MQTKSLVLAALFAAIISVLAQISIPVPFSPVPITGQTFGVFLAGAILGSRMGGLSLLVYILLGAVGLPVFAKACGGIGILVGPTGGYIFGFLIGVYVMGLIIEYGRKITYAKTLLAMTVCMVLYYLVGTFQLSLVMGLDFSKALLVGVVPFVPLDVGKMFLGAGIAMSVRKKLLSAGLLQSSLASRGSSGPI